MTENRLRELFADAVTSAPVEVFDLERAVRLGDRRRRSRNGLVAIGSAGVVAVATLGFIASTNQHPPTSVAAPPSPSAQTATATPEAPALPTLAQLEALARQVAAPAGTGTVTNSDRVVTPTGTESRYVHLHVTTSDGGFDVSTGIITKPKDNVAALAQACALANGGAPGVRTCTELLRSPGSGTWSRTYPAQPGRKTLQFATVLSSGATLVISIDNDTEQPDGSRVIGLAWQDAGITAQSLGTAADALFR